MKNIEEVEQEINLEAVDREIEKEFEKLKGSDYFSRKNILRPYFENLYVRFKSDPYLPLHLNEFIGVPELPDTYEKYEKLQDTLYLYSWRINELCKEYYAFIKANSLIESDVVFSVEKESGLVRYSNEDKVGTKYRLQVQYKGIDYRKIYKDANVQSKREELSQISRKLTPQEIPNFINVYSKCRQGYNSRPIITN